MSLYGAEFVEVETPTLFRRTSEVSIAVIVTYNVTPHYIVPCRKFIHVFGVCICIIYETSMCL